MDNILNDEKPRVILGEYKVTQNLPSEPTVLDEKWDLKTFKKRFRVVIVRSEENELEFDLIGIHPFLANTFRRLMLSDVPTMAIEKVHILNNTSIIQDEVLAHRLGLIPLKADPRLFEMKTDPTAEGTEQDTLEFALKIKCTNNKDSSKDSLRAEDMYKNNNVYSKHIKWVPIGKQKERFSDVGPIHPDILIAKMRPGHELDLKLLAVKSNGRDHAKFSPVATAFYRLLPDIKLLREVEGEAAERLQKCFSPGVISIRHEKGRKYAVVANARYDTGSRNVFRYEDLKDAVAMTKIQDHFIFTVESVGALPPDVIFMEAVKILKDKCLALLDELSHV
ncbi:DNA-directed RNA polymerases I and III subunit RPAC1 [Tribolium castaneum]|uniref:DNA-directed RNA polymerases I and III subunit RPAC1 n=1 Tax=Tribolium castaneum TaxID=7070 RepID=D6WP50_TRICA|nr:PREDICTED: DNA-directed RNA polymerases I and III subunit RPAC1 [Tribolium castaneum]EFA07284.1 DNA-directed RNA polymerases I and III subunit RPAC1-like Protein [Tribolium castaneum]|eukprot:XP_008193784.1 PREDICTED: DNA-directed RNA polymerases I and III subunit RPAC1 [Tribolium castaneum]